MKLANLLQASGVVRDAALQEWLRGVLSAV